MSKITVECINNKQTEGTVPDRLYIKEGNDSSSMTISASTASGDGVRTLHTKSGIANDPTALAGSGVSPLKAGEFDTLIKPSDWDPGFTNAELLDTTVLPDWERASLPEYNLDHISDTDLPYGLTGKAWHCVGDNAPTTNNYNGGFKSSGWVDIDPTKTYRITQWARWANTDGNFYLGHSLKDSSQYKATHQLATGNENSNFYYHGSDLPDVNTWYLIVGYLHPYGTPDNEIRVPEVYAEGDIRIKGYGRSDASLVDPATNKLTVRSFVVYDADNTNGSVAQIYNPRVELVDGTEVPLTTLLNIPKKTGKNPIPLSKRNTLIVGDSWADNTTISLADPQNSPTPPTGYIFKYPAVSTDRIIRIPGPYNNNAHAWVIYNNVFSTGNDGGYHTEYFPVDSTKTYRITQWVKQGSNLGSKYIGIACKDGSAFKSVTSASTGSNNSNPYVFYGDLPSNDEWYLVVSYIRPVGTAIESTDRAKMYKAKSLHPVDVSSDPGIYVNNYIFSAGIDKMLMRSYLFYDSNTVANDGFVAFYMPRCELVDGTETPLSTILGMNLDDIMSDVLTNH